VTGDSAIAVYLAAHKRGGSSNAALTADTNRAQKEDSTIVIASGSIGTGNGRV